MPAPIRIHADPAGETPLMTAARIGKLDAVKLLLDRGAVVDAQGPGVPADGADDRRPRKPCRRSSKLLVERGART